MKQDSVDPEEARAGWYALLTGDDVDLDDWRYTLNDPFDPVALKLPDGATALRSRDFEGLLDAEAVRARALILIARMNGALAISSGARPVRFGGVVRIHEDGRQDAFAFGEMIAFETRCVARFTAVLLGPDGKPVPPSTPHPSPPQLWNELAEAEDDLSDLLDHFGRSDNWYDIYKTIEIAAHLVGGEHRLWKVLEPEARQSKNLKQTANFYRHARGSPLPAEPVNLRDAKPLLAWIVRRVFEMRLATQS